MEFGATDEVRMPFGETPPEPVRSEAFIDERYRFHSEKDREIAQRLASELRENCQAGWITPRQFEQALDSLVALVPADNGNGKRQIDGKTIAPAMEERIASRLTSPEVDIAGPEGSWGRLPETVKKYLTYYDTDMKLELTTNCTVGCAFCAIATKAPVSAKASFESAENLMQDFMGRQRRMNGGYQGYRDYEGYEEDTFYPYAPPIKYDCLYWASDPFDIKWAAAGTTPERDYADLAVAYRQAAGSDSRALFTSTAVPLGEELRVLNFAVRQMNGFSDPDAIVRLSRTTANASRVDHILTIVNVLCPQVNTQQLTVNEVANNVARRGALWNKKDKEITLWDITGPVCRDGAVIGVQSVDGVIMQGASPERPSGELRTPIESIVDGRRVFTIPVHQIRPSLDGNDALSRIYPDTETHTITLDAAGNESIVQEQIANDPHRALLRMAGTYWHYCKQRGQGKVSTPAMTEAMRQHFLPDITCVQDYLSNGGDNWVMKAMLHTLTIDGVIPSGEQN